MAKLIAALIVVAACLSFSIPANAGLGFCNNTRACTHKTSFVANGPFAAAGQAAERPAFFGRACFPRSRCLK
jgi:hypothetical protein